MNNFLKKLVGFSIGPFAGALISLITIPLTTYFIIPTEYGKASMFTLFQTILASLIFLGIDQAYSREYHSSKNKLNLLQNAILVPFLLAITIFIICVVIPQFVSLVLFDSKDYKLPAILFGLMTVLLVMERFIMVSIRMQEKALEYSVINILVKLTVLISTFVFVAFIRRDFLAVVYSAIIGQLIADTYLLIRYRRLFNLKEFFYDKPLVSKMVKFAIPIVIATSMASLLHSLDRIALRAWSDFYQIGIFTAALKIAAILSIIQTSFTSFWVPMAYRWHDEGKSIKYFKIVSDAVLLLMSIVFAGVLIFKDLLVTFLSADYIDTKYIIGFLCMQPIIYTVSETTQLGIIFSRKSVLNIWVSIVSIIPNVLIIYFMVPNYGALGASLATAVSYIFFFTARTYFSNKCGMKFPVVKHYIIMFILFIGAIINSFEWPNVMLANILLLLIVVVIQVSTIKTIRSLIKNRNLSSTSTELKELS